jgi:hypothetical protein
VFPALSCPVLLGQRIRGPAYRQTFFEIALNVFADGSDTSLGAAIGVVHHDCGEAQGNSDHEGNGE